MCWRLFSFSNNTIQYILFTYISLTPTSLILPSFFIDCPYENNMFFKSSSYLFHFFSLKRDSTCFRLKLMPRNMMKVKRRRKKWGKRKKIANFFFSCLLKSWTISRLFIIATHRTIKNINRMIWRCFDCLCMRWVYRSENTCVLSIMIFFFFSFLSSYQLKMRNNLFVVVYIFFFFQSRKENYLQLVGELFFTLKKNLLLQKKYLALY